MKTKVLKSGLAALMAAIMGLSMTGCGNKAVDNSEMEYVTYLNAGEDDPVVEGFKKENPDINVKFNILDGSNYEKLLQPRMMSGDAPDVMLMQTTDMYKKYKNEKWIADIGDTEAGKKIKADEGLMSVLGGENGEVYGIPIDGGASGILIYYNKKIFDKYNISVPQTQDEFFAACETLKTNGVDPMVFGGADAWTIAGPFGDTIANEYSCSVFGVDYTDKVAEGKLDYSETQREGLEVFEKLLNSGYIAKSSSSLTYEQSVQYFADGKAAMIAQGTWLAELEQITNADSEILELGAFAYPGAGKNADGKRVVKQGIGRILVVLKDSPNIEAAKKFADYFASEEVLKDYLERQDAMPALPGVKVEVDPLFKDYYAETEDASKTEIVTFTPLYNLPNAMGAAREKAYQNILAGSSSAEELKKLDFEFEQNKDKITKNN